MPVARHKATGAVKWLDRCPETGNSYLQITVQRASGETVSADYQVEAVKGGYDLTYLNTQFELVTYKLRFVPNGGLTCNCPDANGTTDHCKHSRGLRAGLRSGPF